MIWLFPPEKPERSKTGCADDTVAIDSGRLSWLAPVLRILAERGEEKLFGSSYPVLVAGLSAACNRLHIRFVSYQMRHSGASVDRASRRHTLEQLQKRGRWQSHHSVRRYEKTDRLNESWRQLTPAQQTYFEMCVVGLRDVILNGGHIPALPLRG